jgi:hypothetical protein
MQRYMTTKTETAPETNVFSTLGDALESAAEKFEEGSAVAGQSVKEAAKVTGNLLVDGVYKAAYWTSYGFVFSGVYLIELLPETSSFRRGLEEGATDAQTKVPLLPLQAEDIWWRLKCRSAAAEKRGSRPRPQLRRPLPIVRLRWATPRKPQSTGSASGATPPRLRP